MTSLLMAVILQTAVLATGVEATPIASKTYSEARQIVTETGKPLVVMVSTDWCPPCQTMKKILPRVLEGGMLRKVAFALVNPDRDHELAEKLIGNGPIPQLVMFRRKGDGWVRKTLVGGQSVETVEQFIEEGVADDKKENPSSETNAVSEENAPPDEPATSTREVVHDDKAFRHG